MSPTYIHTEYRQNQLDRVLKSAAGGAAQPALDHDVDISAKTETVGEVVLDKSGNLAAASSTGGQTAKGDGRVSDSSIAGFFANSDVAISGTGNGDFFLRRSTSAVLAERYNGVLTKAEDIPNEDIADCGPV